MVEILDALFNAQAKSIAAHGGEILKFIVTVFWRFSRSWTRGVAEVAADKALKAANETWRLYVGSMTTLC
jgi:hypothetical protein